MTTPDAVLAARGRASRRRGRSRGRRRRRRRAPRRARRGRTGRHPRLRRHLPGYRGWHWAVRWPAPPRAQGRHGRRGGAAARRGCAARARPGCPWQERLQPGDLSPGDLLPAEPENDPRLVPAYLLSDDPAVEAVAFELGLGRVRVHVARGPAGRRRALAGRRPRSGHPDGPAGPGALRHLRVLPAAGRLAAGRRSGCAATR